MSIFISIASYCDPLLPFTVSRAVAMARQPQALHVGIVDQSPATSPPPQFQAAGARVSYVRIDPAFARGPCWARFVAMSLFEGEDWYLQVDSHTDFEAGWDARLAGLAADLANGRSGFAITAYPQPFFVRDGQAWRDPLDAHALASTVKAGTGFSPGHPVLTFQAIPTVTQGAIPGFHVGAGCLFAPGEFVQHFPYDPWIYFHGEEQAIAARLFTHGWDIFHVPGLPVFHLYNDTPGQAPLRPMHWDAAQDERRAVHWTAFEARSRKRLAALVAGEVSGAWGLGSRRTLADYADFCGIDYSRRTIAPRAYRPMAG